MTENKSTVIIDAMISVLFILLLSTTIVWMFSATTTFDFILIGVIIGLYLFVIGRGIVIFMKEVEVMRNRLEWYDKREGERLKEVYDEN